MKLHVISFTHRSTNAVEALRKGREYSRRVWKRADMWSHLLANENSLRKYLVIPGLGLTSSTELITRAQFGYVLTCFPPA